MGNSSSTTCCCCNGKICRCCRKDPLADTTPAIYRKRDTDIQEDVIFTNVAFNEETTQTSSIVCIDIKTQTEVITDREPGQATGHQTEADRENNHQDTHATYVKNAGTVIINHGPFHFSDENANGVATTFTWQSGWRAARSEQSQREAATMEALQEMRSHLTEMTEELRRSRNEAFTSRSRPNHASVDPEEARTHLDDGFSALVSQMKGLTTEVSTLQTQLHEKRQRLEEEREQVMTFALALESRVANFASNLQSEQLTEFAENFYRDFNVRLLGFDCGLTFLMEAGINQWPDLIGRQVELQERIRNTLIPEEQRGNTNFRPIVQVPGDIDLREGEPLPPAVVSAIQAPVTVEVEHRSGEVMAREQQPDIATDHKPEGIDPRVDELPPPASVSDIQGEQPSDNQQGLTSEQRQSVDTNHRDKSSYSAHNDDNQSQSDRTITIDIHSGSDQTDKGKRHSGSDQTDKGKRHTGSDQTDKGKRHSGSDQTDEGKRHSGSDQTDEGKRHSGSDQTDEGKRHSGSDQTDEGKRHSGSDQTDEGKRHSGSDQTDKGKRHSGSDQTDEGKRHSGSDQTDEGKRHSGSDQTDERKRHSGSDQTDEGKRHSGSDQTDEGKRHSGSDQTDEGKRHSGSDQTDEGKRHSGSDQTDEGKRHSGSDQTDEGKRHSGSDQTDEGKRHSGSDQTDEGKRHSGSDQTDEGKRHSGSDQTDEGKRHSGSDQTDEGKRHSGSDQTDEGKRHSGSDQTDEGKRHSGSDQTDEEKRHSGSDRSHIRGKLHLDIQQRRDQMDPNEEDKADKTQELFETTGLSSPSQTSWYTSVILDSASSRVFKADCSNSMISAATISLRTDTSKRQLEVRPWALALLKDGATLAVTSENEKQILFVNVSDLSIVKTIHTSRLYRGVGEYASERLVVSCCKDEDGEASVDVITWEGKVESTLATSQKLTGLSHPHYLFVHNDDVFISDFSSDCVYRVDRNTGEMIDTMTDPQLQSPCQVSVDPAGKLYVASWTNGRVLKKSSPHGKPQPLLVRERNAESGYEHSRCVSVTDTNLLVSWDRSGGSPMTSVLISYRLQRLGNQSPRWIPHHPFNFVNSGINY